MTVLESRWKFDKKSHQSNWRKLPPEVFFTTNASLDVREGIANKISHAQQSQKSVAPKGRHPMQSYHIVKKTQIAWNIYCTFKEMISLSRNWSSAHGLEPITAGCRIQEQVKGDPKNVPYLCFAQICSRCLIVLFQIQVKSVSSNHLNDYHD